MKSKLHWITKHDKKEQWSLPANNPFLKFEGEMYPFNTYKTQAIFDPQVDYMYINKLTFDHSLVPLLQSAYVDDIDCSETECHFDKPCDAVPKKGLELHFSLGGTDSKEYYAISIKLDDYLIDGKKQWDKKNYSCYMPIFVVNPGIDVDVFNMWFLGNMFLDKYLVVTDMKEIGSLRVGLLDKYKH